MGMSYEVNDRMNERCAEAIVFMRGAGMICTSDLCAQFGWHLNHVSAVIRWLKDDKYIRELPKKLNRVWFELIDPDKEWVEREFHKVPRNYVRKEVAVDYKWQDNPFLASFMGYQCKPQGAGRKVDNSNFKNPLRGLTPKDVGLGGFSSLVAVTYE